MIPAMCLTNDDCVRACIASLLELDTEAVPHWYADIPHGDEFASNDANNAMQDWLAKRGYIIAIRGYFGSQTLEDVQRSLVETYGPQQHYMLWCDSGGDHAVIGCGNKIAWNPAWYKSPIDGPHSCGMWLVWIIAKL